MTSPVVKQGENVGCAFISRPGGLMNAFCVARLKRTEGIIIYRVSGGTLVPVVPEIFRTRRSFFHKILS